MFNRKNIRGEAIVTYFKIYIRLVYIKLVHYKVYNLQQSISEV